MPGNVAPGIGWPSGKPNIPGGRTSWTTTGSFPWSKGHSSPRIQNPFSVKKKQNNAILYPSYMYMTVHPFRTNAN